MQFKPSTHSQVVQPVDQLAPQGSVWSLSPRANPTPVTGLTDGATTYDVLEDGALKRTGGAGTAGSLVYHYSDEWQATIRKMVAIPANAEKLVQAFGQSEMLKFAPPGTVVPPDPFYKKPWFWVACGVAGVGVLGTVIYISRK